MAESLEWKERKRELAKGQEKQEKRKKKNKANGLKKKKMKAQSANVCQRHKSEKKMMRSTKCLKKKSEM